MLPFESKIQSLRASSAIEKIPGGLYMVPSGKRPSVESPERSPDRGNNIVQKQFLIFLTISIESSEKSRI